MLRMAIPDPYPPSEFGGKTRRNRVQPVPPHELTASEKLMLTYTTGDDTAQSNPDKGEAFSGLLPADVQRKLRKDAGHLEKGQYDPFEVT